MITIYWVLEEENAEIANFELKDNILGFDIDTGDLHEKQGLPIKFAKSHETLEIKGMSRLNELAIFHVVVNPMRHRELPGTQKSYITFRGREHLRDIKLSDPTHTETFRSGDRITVFWHRSEKSKKNWHNWTKGSGKSDTIDDRGLPNNWVEKLSITGVEPHENIKLIGIGNTPEIFIAYFRVLSNSTE